MYKVIDIKNKIKEYEKENNRLNDLFQDLKKTVSLIDLEEIEKTMDYKEVKAFYKEIMFMCSDKEVLKKIENIKDLKKIEEYPEIKDVHYYPIIKNLNIKEEEKIGLDIFLKEAYSNGRKRREIENLNPNTLKLLIENEIVEKRYIFSCWCNSFDCEEVIKTEKEIEKLKRYWNDEPSSTDLEEQKGEYFSSSFEVFCANENIEVYDMKSFEEARKIIEYKVKVKPDMTLDNI